MSILRCKGFAGNIKETKARVILSYFTLIFGTNPFKLGLSYEEFFVFTGTLPM